MSPASRPRRVLVVGSGGREHAIAWRLSRDPDPPELLAAPGNDGTAPLARRIAVSDTDVAALVDVARRERIDLVVVGPETPLALGLVDALSEAGIPAFGPTRAAAAIESSKAHAKELMREAGVPTAPAAAFTDAAAALAALDAFGPPWVIKADGLAAGKGVRVTDVRTEAEAFVRACLDDGRFGAAGSRVLLEAYLEGEELSVMAVTDGNACVVLPAARDHKRAYDDDRGPNTGGMGACAPALEDARVESEILERIITPVLARLRERGTPYRGVLYVGLVLGPGGPRVLEFNARFGDPETEAVLPLVAGDLTTLLASAAAGHVEPGAVKRTGRAAVTVALVDEGYPDAVRGDGWIEGLEEVASADLLVFHAGTAAAAAGRWVVRGGRAAYVTARAADVATAREHAYAAIARLRGEGWRSRCDIAGRAAVGMRG